MKTVLNKLKPWRALLLLLVVFFLADTGLGLCMNRYIMDSGYIWRNDYELTRQVHPEKEWDKVFFGNSAVISAYREDTSEAGYVNLGLDYGVITDLWAMIRRGDIKIGSELVIGLNYLTVYDDLETNPSYPWHRKLWEPYSYFRRDDLSRTLKDWIKAAITGNAPEKLWDGQTKAYYYGCLNQAELDEKIQNYIELYWNQPIEKFSENLEALEEIHNWCRDNGVRLRVVWMPWHPEVEQPELSLAVRDAVEEICSEREISFLDLSNEFSAECFYDLGHLNREYGSYLFTEVIDPWLLS